jgi:putative ABC transport system substrate-binding protein
MGPRPIGEPRGDRRQATSRLRACVAFALCLCGTVLSTFAQAAEIAILQSSDIPAYHEAISGFKATVPNTTIYTEYDLQSDLALGKKLARKIRASDASLVLAVGLKAALAAKQEILDIPIVYMMVMDPQKHQLAAPNMAGTTLDVPVDRQLQIIRSFLPNVRRLGALYDPQKSASKVKEANQSASAHAFALQARPVDSERDVPQQLRAALSHDEALWLLPDSTVITNESVRFILESALERRIPVIGFSPEFTRLGALISISLHYREVGRETGALARRLLDGDRSLLTKSVPIERVKITVNLKTAKFFGLSFSEELTGLIDETY